MRHPRQLLLVLLVVRVSSAAPHSTGSPSTPPQRRLGKRDGEKAVFAHVVQGDFQNYSQESFSADMAMAIEAGIAAFALNVGGDSSDADELVKAFAAAEDLGFGLFFSFDMNYFTTSGSSDTMLNTYLTPYLTSSAYYLVDGAALVSTFSGGVSGTFLDGTSTLADSDAAWETLLANAASAASVTISFAPGFFDTSLVSQQPYMDRGGTLSWAAWGDSGRTDDMTTTADEAYITAASAASLYYIAPVAAFFFVHVESNNNKVMNSNNHLLSNHYSDLIALDTGPRFIELLTWNDFGEGHYLGPVRSDAGVPSGATAYSDSAHDHPPVLWTAAYYNYSFVNGSPPTITSLACVFYYRVHSASATASDDTLDAPEYASTLDDQIFVIVFVPSGSSASIVVVTTGGAATDGQALTEGVNLISVDFIAGATGVSVQDSDGTELLSGTGIDITDSPTTYDFNFYAYILPENATASSFLDISSSASITSSTSSTALTPSSSSGTAAVHSSSNASSGSSRSTGSSTSGGTASTTKSSSVKPSGTSTSATSQTDGADGGSGTADDGTSTSSSTGLPAYGWVAVAAALVFLFFVAFLLSRKRPRRSRRRHRRRRRRREEEPSSSSSSTSSAIETGSSSSSSSGSESDSSSTTTTDDDDFGESKRY